MVVWMAGPIAACARASAERPKTIPACEQCGGILRARRISFGQPLVPEVIERAMRAAQDAGPAAGDPVEPAGLSGGRHRPPRERGRRPSRHHQRGTDPVR